MSIKGIKEIVNRNKILLENFSYLSILQIISLVFPLLTYPYLLRLFGLDLYGIIIFAQTIVTNIAILINYGFNLSGTHAIATNCKSKETIDQAVSSIYIIKFSIWAISFCIYSGVVLFFDYFANYRSLFLISFFITINDVLLPVWYFQGIEKMKYITFINAGTRLIFVALIFVFVKNQADYILVPVLNSFGAFFGGLAALFIVFRRHGVNFSIQKGRILKYYFNNSTPFFISSLSVNVYANISRLIVGAFLGMREITIYDMAEKITSIMKIPGSLVCQAAFPRICKLKSIHLVNKLMTLTLSGLTVIYLLCYILADKIVVLLSGEIIPEATTIIRILTLSALCSTANGFFGSNRLVVWGYKQAYMKVAMSGCLIYLFIISIIYISNTISIYSIALAPLITEFSIVVIYIILSSKYNLLTSKNTAL